MYLVLLDVSIVVVLVAATFMLTLGQQTSYVAVFAELLRKCIEEAYTHVSVRLAARTLAFFLLLANAGALHGQLVSTSASVKYLGETSSSLVTGTSDSLLLALDGNGNLLLGDSAKGQVSRVAMTGGVPVVVMSNVPGITAIAGDATGRVLVAAQSLDHIVEVQAGSATKTALGSGLNNVQSMVLDAQGDLIIADTGNNRVVHVTPSDIQSTFVDSITAPTAVFLDSTNDLFVGSAGALTAYRTNGTITSVGQGWSKPIAISQSGNQDLYVLDSGLRQLVVVNANTSAQSVLLGTHDPVKPTSVMSDAGGDLYVFDNAAHQVVKLDAGIELGSVKAGTPTSKSTLTFKFLATTTLAHLFTSTQGMVDGQLQVTGGSCLVNHTYESGDLCTVILQAMMLKAGQWNGDLTLIDASGNSLLDTQVFATGIAPLQGLLPGLAQTYYRNPYSYTGELIPSSLAVDAAGNLYIGDDANARVLRVATNGDVDVVLSNSTDQNVNLNDPLALAIDGKGDVLVADESLAWGIAPNPSTPGATGGSVFTAIAYGQWGPSAGFVSFMAGLAVQPGGGFFFSDSGNNRVIAVDNTGFGTEILNGSTVVGDNGQGLNYPTTLAMDSNGALLIADFGNQRIVQRFADGTVHELVSPGTPAGRSGTSTTDGSGSGSSREYLYFRRLDEPHSRSDTTGPILGHHGRDNACRRKSDHSHQQSTDACTGFRWEPVHCRCRQ